MKKKLIDISILAAMIFLLIVHAALSQTEEKAIGDEIELSAIRFEGNSFASESILKGIIASKNTPMWFWKFLNTFSGLGKGPVYFDSTLLIRDTKIIESYYKDNGFFKVRVGCEYFIDTANNSAEIIFRITENKRSKVNSYNYSKIRNSYDSAYYHEFFYEQFSLRPDNYFSREMVEKDIASVINHLKITGFMLAEKENTLVEIDTVSDIVNIEVNINRGKYYLIDTVRVERKGEGKDKVDDELVYNIVDIEKGEKYSAEKIALAQIRLYRTELFTSALINSVISDTVGNRVPLNVSLDVGKINELSPEFLINNLRSTFNIGLGLNYIRKNFLGDARKFSVTGILLAQDIFKINYGNAFGKNGFDDSTVIGSVRIATAIEQPYVFNKSISGQLEIYTNAEQQKIYKYLSFGASLGFKFEMPQFAFFNGINTSLLFEYETIYFREQFFREILISYYKSIGVQYTEEELNSHLKKQSLNKINQSNVILGVDLLSMHSNDIFSPTLGYNLQINLENAGLVAVFRNLLYPNSDPNTEYYKANFLVTTYTNPWKPALGGVAYKLRIGYMQKYGGISDIPVTKLFYSGGSNSIRGWAARALGTASSAVNDSGQVVIASQNGGKFLLEGSLETRNRIIGDIGTAVFLDFGNVWNNTKSFTWESVAVALGIGVRYYSSFAPFRLDFGFRLYDPTTKKWNYNQKIFSNIEIHFGIGEAF